MNRRLLVTGSRGQLGTDLMSGLCEDYEALGVDIEELDICNLEAVKDCLRFWRPEIVIHAAAYADVDGCETNPDLAWAVNVGGTGNIAGVCREIGAKLVYISTDYVFDGTKKSPYLETDLPNPQTIYGRSKLEGEKLVTAAVGDCLILRIAWLYGRRGKNFVRTMVRLGIDQLEARKRGHSVNPLRVVNDQFGNPTWSEEIAAEVKVILKKNLIGVIHCTSEGMANWYEFARAVFDEMAMDVDLVPCTTKEFPRPAPRPRFTVLENARLKELGLNRMNEYRPALNQFIKQYGDTLRT